MTKKNRYIAALLALTVLFVMLFSVFFIAEKSCHECTGENCTVCYQINIYKNTIRFDGFSTVPAAVFCALSAAVLTVVISGNNCLFCRTPIQLKTKLLN